MAEGIIVRLAGADDAERVATQVHGLLAELAGKDHIVPSLETVAATARKLLTSDDPVWGLLALDEAGNCLGLLMLNQCAAIYAGGRFGEITELYVQSPARSLGVGRRLIEAARVFAKERGWTRLEVGAPDVPRWQRTVDFYRGYGFEEVGPRLRLGLGN
ncbi:MAG: GNAT family N-acetyltransferase [Hyphomicrobiaceae bacterium]